MTTSAAFIDCSNLAASAGEENAIRSRSVRTSVRPSRCPSTSTTPADGCWYSDAIRNRDVLPAPFAASHLVAAPSVDPGGYAIRRAARIYPAYWLVLAFFTFVVARVNIYGGHGFLLHTSLTFTYTHIKNPFVIGLPPAWSLVVEV